MSIVREQSMVYNCRIICYLELINVDVVILTLYLNSVQYVGCPGRILSRSVYCIVLFKTYHLKHY